MAVVPRLLTIPTVAHTIFNDAVSVQRLYSLVRRGVLPSVRLGRQVWVPEDRLLEFINAGGRGLDDLPDAVKPEAPPPASPPASRPRRAAGGGNAR